MAIQGMETVMEILALEEAPLAKKSLPSGWVCACCEWTLQDLCWRCLTFDHTSPCCPPNSLPLDQTVSGDGIFGQGRVLSYLVSAPPHSHSPDISQYTFPPADPQKVSLHRIPNRPPRKPLDIGPLTSTVSSFDAFFSSFHSYVFYQ